MSRVATRSNEARSTAAEVKSLSERLSAEAEALENGVREFLGKVRAG